MPQERALARAVAAHQRDPLARLDPQVDAAQDRRAVAQLVPQPARLERRGCAAAPNGERTGCPAARLRRYAAAGISAGAGKPRARVLDRRRQRAQSREGEHAAPPAWRAPAAPPRPTPRNSARRGVAHHAPAARARSRGRPPAGSARAGARPSARPCPTPRSAAAAARPARRPRRGRAARSARRAPAARGRCASAAASATRCNSPPESVSTERSSSRAMPSTSAASSTARATAPGATPRCSSGSAISARTPFITTCDSGSWNTVPQMAASSPGPWSRTLRPPTSSSPRASPPWKCGTSPQAARSSVDLPLPGLAGQHGEAARLDLEVETSASAGVARLRVAVAEPARARGSAQAWATPSRARRPRTGQPGERERRGQQRSVPGPERHAHAGSGCSQATPAAPRTDRQRRRPTARPRATRRSCRDHGRGARRGARAVA